MQIRTVSPAFDGRLTCAQTGERLDPPPGWALLPPGDATLTRRVKAAGPHWVAEERKGRKTFSRGVWAPAERIEAARAELARERATPAYARRLAASRARRAREHENYVADFHDAVLTFLDFPPRYARLGRALAERVTEHTTPVGSGTVGRTKRIPLERRAASAVIAWMRHQTTGYDSMQIPRARGERRDVRRQLARRSRALLDRLRRGEAVDPAECALHRALGLAAEEPPRAAPLPAPEHHAAADRSAAPRRVRALGVPAPAAGRRLWERGLG